MGTFRKDYVVENVLNRSKSALVPNALVDTGSEYSWLPSETLRSINVAREKKDLTFVMANGQQVTRGVGFAIIRMDDAFTVDEVVFGEPGDLTLLGARSLEGLNLTVDPGGKKLLAAGPRPAASEAKRVEARGSVAKKTKRGAKRRG
jgi:predicted aspartyl protease